MNADIEVYINRQIEGDTEICRVLCQVINGQLTEAESKIWHAHPVWFIDGNPIVGFSKQKRGIRLMFWSGADFEESELNELGSKFKDASVFYSDVKEINAEDLIRWLKKARTIQWDYKNIVKRRGKLMRLV